MFRWGGIGRRLRSGYIEEELGGFLIIVFGFCVRGVSVI